jgi:hypothetical protein
MDEADASATGADGESGVPGLGPGPGPVLPVPVSGVNAASSTPAARSPQRPQPKQERTKSAELLLQMLHERRLDPANSVPARNSLELKRSLKLEPNQSDSGDTGTGIAGGAAGRAVAGQGPHAKVGDTRGSGGANVGDLSEPPGPGQKTDPVQRLARSIQQIDHLDVQFTSLSAATNWAYYEVGMAYAAFGQVRARSTPDQVDPPDGLYRIGFTVLRLPSTVD